MKPKTIVLATEQDVIGLRTHIRKEPFYLYKLNISELFTKALLLNFLRTAESLNNQPAFYNSLIDNCMTGLLAESKQYSSLSNLLDYRVILPGYSDELAYEKGLLENSVPFLFLREQSRVESSNSRISDSDFSIRIRQKKHNT